MKIYIQTDLEGVAGFCFRENRKNHDYENIRHRHRMYQLLTGEVNAAVRAAFDSGADEVIVNDNHGSGYNILFEQLDPRCRIIHGRNSSGAEYLERLDGSFDALVMIGMHAMGGTPVSIIPHTRWEINEGEIYLSEASMAAAIAGDRGVPAVMVSGDDKITAELHRKIPGIVKIMVKEALSPYQALSVIPSRSCEMIYQGVREGIVRRGQIGPYLIPGPVRLNLWDTDDHVPPLRLIGSQPAEGNTITDALYSFERRYLNRTRGIQQPDGFNYP